MTDGYSNYTGLSKPYDSTRVPAGLDAILSALCTSSTPLADIKLISPGCGTGTYEIELAAKVKEVHGIDNCPDMIKRAREKSQLIPNTHFYQGEATDLSQFNGFDAALFNQSLHHIGNFDQQHKAIQETYNTLNTNGMIIIHTPSQRQLTGGFWYFDLIPEAAAKIREKVMPLPDLIKVLKKAGFEYQGKLIPTDAILQGKDYFNIDGILSPEWRAGDSTWNLVTDEELQRAQQRIADMTENQTIGPFLEEREKLRADIGQITIIYANKAAGT